MIKPVNRHLLLLVVCQGLFLTNNVTFIAINGLVGWSLAPLGWMATLPVTGYVVGAALSALPVMGVGVVLNFGCVAVALSGVDLMQFLVALFVLGVGWNFLYTGGSTLLTQTYRPEEKNKAQGAMDLCVFSTMALSSFASGALITTQGWTWLNLGSLLPIGVVGAMLVWLAYRRREAAGDGLPK